MFSWILVYAVALLATVATAASVDPDPFYHPAHGWEDKRPGDVLRKRSVTPKVFDRLGLDIKAYQILYRTSGTTPQEPSFTVTTVLVPTNATRDRVVLQPSHQNSADAACAPSHRITESLGSEALFSAYTWHGFLKKGYTVIAPDFQGPSSAFGAGRLAGHMSLDAVRATLASDVAPLSKQSKVVGYGYSGGSQPVGWAASLQRGYAPELNTVGWALGGTVADVGALMRHQDGGRWAGYAFTDIVGLEAAYPDLKKALRNRWTSEGKRMVKFVKEHCSSDIQQEFQSVKLQSDKFFKLGGLLFVEPSFLKVFDTLVMGSKRDETPVAPVLMYHAFNDATVPYGPATHTAKQWAAHGGNITFVTDIGKKASHASEELKALSGVLAFTDNRFEGKPFHKGLKTSISDFGHEHY